MVLRKLAEKLILVTLSLSVLECHKRRQAHGFNKGGEHVEIIVTQIVRFGHFSCVRRPWS